MSTNTVNGGLGISYYCKSVADVLSKVVIVTDIDPPILRGTSKCGIQV